MENFDPRENWRAYWRILFDVIQGVPRLQQEISIWPINGLVRLAYQMKELNFAFLGAAAPDHDRVVFNGGYIECDSDLDTDIRALAVSAGLNTGILGPGSVAINGENVYIRADVAIAEPLDESPIFYFPQPGESGVRLLEVYNPAEDNRAVKFSISNQFYLTKNHFSLERFRERHGLQVDQGLDRSRNVFTFVVDSTPLENRPTIADHRFETPMQKFYIGWTPNSSEGLYGAVYHLVFDPNKSCGSCPRPTFEGTQDWEV